MDKINDGGPAFPCAYFDRPLYEDLKPTHGVLDAKAAASVTSPGLTVRDYFAAKAMQGLCTNESWLANAKSHGGVTDQVAGAAYEMADAMLAARGTA